MQCSTYLFNLLTIINVLCRHIKICTKIPRVNYICIIISHPEEKKINENINNLSFRSSIVIVPRETFEKVKTLRIDSLFQSIKYTPNMQSIYRLMVNVSISLFLSLIFVSLCARPILVSDMHVFLFFFYFILIMYIIMCSLS